MGAGRVAVDARAGAGWYRNVVARTRRELDLLDAGQLRISFARERPEFVFLAAAKVVGGGDRQDVELVEGVGAGAVAV
jgi:hypothetical protein